MKKVIIWGAGGTGKRIVNDVRNKYEVVAFVDKNMSKWGECIDGVTIYDPEYVINDIDFDYVIIASQPGFQTINRALSDWGVDESRIISKYVEQPLIARIQFLKDLSNMMTKAGIEGSCMEAGVFEGDFASQINACFPQKELYLFDTFEGFPECDVETESILGTSKASIGDYSQTSINQVYAKMRYPDKVSIIKGYFPDSARDIECKFCFVNLDMDLYLPTIKGLNFIRNRIVAGGVVLVHDYYSDVFMGPQKAVDEFLQKYPELSKYPIGDGISIMITGF